MNWFFIALIGPLLYAISNHLDKYIIKKYFKSGEVGAIAIFSAIFSVIALPIIYIIDNSVFSVDWTTMIVLALIGALNVISLIMYLYAINGNEVSMVVPFYQTIPIFGFILGYFILGETLGIRELLSGLLIILGASILSFEISGKTILFKKKVVILMLLSSFLYSTFSVIFKLIAIDQGFWQSIFWSFFGNVIIGVIILLTVKSYRKQFVKVFEKNGSMALSLNSFNELLFISAEGITSFAYLLAPVALVMTVDGFQPFFVFVIGIILTVFFPKISKESMTKKILIQKFAAIAIIISGTLLLNLGGV